MRKNQPWKWGMIAPLLLCMVFLMPASHALAQQGQFPTYPNLESFSIKNSPLSSYITDQVGRLTPNYFFPELKGYQTTTLNDNAPLKMTSGNFSLSGETGPSGNVTGAYKWEGYSRQEWSSGEFDLYEVTAEGQITNAKAAYDNYGLLRITGAAHYERKFEFSGPVTITMKYSAMVWDDTAQDQVRIEGRVSAQSQFAYISCISDEKDINLCHFNVGKGYGDYGFEGNFINSTAYDDYVWFNNLDFEFQLIEGINFDPEAHHKLTQQPDEEQAEEPEIIFDDSYLDDLEKAEKIADDPTAGFNALVSCDSPINTGDAIVCNLNITGGTENQPYTVNWVLDGYLIKSGTVLLNADNIIFPNPPPGDHPIEVQVIDQATYAARVANTVVEVIMPESMDKLSPWSAAWAGAGSVAILGAWLWSEWAAAKFQQDWFDNWFENQNQQDRSEWYEKQMAKNDEERAMRKVVEDKLKAYNKACEDESKRFRDELIKITNKYENSDYLIDLYNDMLLDDVYRDGKWDAKQLLRLEEYINNQLKIDRQAESLAEWQRQMKSLNKRQAEFTDLAHSWTAIGIEVTAGLMTGGASELLFIPLRASCNAIYAAKRANLLKKTGWENAKYVMMEAGFKLGVEAIFIEGAQAVVPKLFSAIGWVGKKIAKRVLKPETIKGIKEVAKRWMTDAGKAAQAPKGNPKLPVIKNYWGKGPKVYVSQPSGSWVNPKPAPRVDFGMDNFLNNRIRPISNELADDMGHLFREGININPNANNLVKMTDKIVLSQSDDIALKLINNPLYKQAVEQGVVPTSVQQIVYQARDKVCRRAIQQTFKQLDGVMLGGKTASSYIKSVAITGTGAKPLSPQGIGRFTDFDSTVIAGETETAKRAEKMFADTFHKQVSERLNAKAAEVKMFPGFRSGDAGAHSGGYISDPMLHWTKVDVVNRGKSAVRLKDGTIMFNSHPDVAPIPKFGPFDQIRYPTQTGMAEAAFADASSVVTNDVAKAMRATGGSLTQEQILIKHGKQAYRAWVATNAGKGATLPTELRRLMELKSNPGTRLNPAEVPHLWEFFTKYLDLPANLGANV